jgi:hypothetical protein
VRFLLVFTFVSALLSTPFALGDPRWLQQGIYGPDDRLEPHEVQDPRIRHLSLSSVALIAESNLLRRPGGFLVSSKTFGEEKNLCPGERFREQPAAAFCSGVLIGRDLVLTAGHCLEGAKHCRQTKFVFGYAISPEGRAPDFLAAEDVYDCRDILYWESLGENQQKSAIDYAIIRLSRPVQGRPTAGLSRTGGPRQGDYVLAVGYPAGIPLKFLTGGKVRRAGQSTFETDLDAYEGSSGSPVYSLASGKLEGILIEGEEDFELSPGGCFVSKQCQPDECEGESILKVDTILSRIKHKAGSLASDSSTFGEP